MDSIKKYKIIASILLIIVVVLFLMFLNPIHYWNLFLIKLQFIGIHNINPTGTNFIWQKSYIGGLGSNGNGDCNYVVGELRSFNGSREKIIEQYEKILGDNKKAGILFMDGDKWPLDSILWDWRSDFLIQNHIEEGGYYIIYIAKRFPALLYLGCPSY